jgi:alpha-amylase/alpha-mannosidase (GH57 family)
MEHLSQPRSRMKRFICIHGHFYQPPRENPWLEAIELQDSAAPYHDWNARITAECYAPNSVSRILDEQNRIVKLVNNYARMSFNFGPTLLYWLADKSPAVYDAILAADRDSIEKFSGHGSAIAQPYNHMIMPLANRRDRITQIVWGIRDFETRFERKPEGMWLPETAVDLETLELLADFGIQFTILAPHQAARTRRIGQSEWLKVEHGGIDTNRAYRQRLPSGKSLALFFYNGPIARAVAFEGLLSHGERFIERLYGAFSQQHEQEQLVHIATDGESYGHHHRFGDMALAYALDRIEADPQTALTNYGEFLARQPPSYEVEIVEKSSWSCAHGIDRWWSNCGCNTGGNPSWNQQWRTPLRNTLDWLRDTVAPQWEHHSGQLLKDPWAARDAYIDVVNDRSAKNVENFFACHALRPLEAQDQSTALKLLEMQRHAMLMYTSCGWFFDDIAGIEAVQILQFAGRAVQLAQTLFGDSLENQFLHRLSAARSNLSEQSNGAAIYERRVQPAKVDWEKLAAHYAVNSLFEEFPKQTTIYCYDVASLHRQVFPIGRTKLAFGQIELRSTVTRDSKRLHYGALHFGDQNVNGGVIELPDDQSYRETIEETVDRFNRADLTGVIRVMARRFGDSNYSLQSLFRDEQRKTLETILQTDLAEAEVLYRQIYERRAPIMRFLTGLNIPLPKGFAAAAEVVLNSDLRRGLAKPVIDAPQVIKTIDTAKIEGVTLDSGTLEFAFRHSLEHAASRFAAEPTLSTLGDFHNAADLLQYLPFPVDLWTVQNVFYEQLQKTYPAQVRATADGDEAARGWVKSFTELGSRLGIKVL